MLLGELLFHVWHEDIISWPRQLFFVEFRKSRTVIAAVVAREIQDADTGLLFHFLWCSRRE